MEDGLEHPIGFSSRTLTLAESRYSQSDNDVVLLKDDLSTGAAATADAIKMWALRDPVLSKVYHFIRSG